ncbi:MAG TPA: SDR family NAD(P)-dependent oxidoreductase, partial [Solirubrobacterales bacterium]|nr:SDR family NAD(P)-dependent oxidoreductase [Solirubrobacterales bacterium]
VADEEAVERFAAATVARFDRLDVWVNGAGTIAYGDFLDLPSDVFRRVIETNLLGQVHGARAALRRFVPQGHGVLINMSSVWGRVSSPQVSPYVASKHAVRAFSESIRSEVEHLPEVFVTTIAPEAVDTPIFANAANYGGRRVRPIPPVLSADEVAAGIEACAEHPKREVTYGRAGRALEVLYSLAPPLYRRLAHPAFVAGTFDAERRGPSSGNVLRPQGRHAVAGGWRERRGDLRRAFLAAARAALRGRGDRGRPPA